MANPTFTGEGTPSGGGPGCRWHKPSTGEWYTYNMSTGEWDIDQDGFDAVKVADLTVSGSVTVGSAQGLTGEFEGTIKKIKVEKGIITELEVE